MHVFFFLATLGAHNSKPCDFASVRRKGAIDRSIDPFIHPVIHPSMDTELGVTISEAAADVYERLGSGLSECIYQNALAIALRQRGCEVETEVVVPIFYDNSYVGFVRPDIVVNKQVVLELKSVAKVVESHLVQLRAYLQWLPPRPPSCERIDSLLMGAVINFGGGVVEVKAAMREACQGVD